jgi:hypothetical protein
MLYSLARPQVMGRRARETQQTRQQSPTRVLMMTNA